MLRSGRSPVPTNTKSVSIWRISPPRRAVPDAGDPPVAEHLGQLGAGQDLDAAVGHHRDHVVAQPVVNMVQARGLHERAAGQDRGLAPGRVEERAVLQRDLGAAHDHAPVRLVVELLDQRREVVDALAVHAGDIRVDRAGPGAQHQVPGTQPLPVHLDGVLVDDRGRGVEHVLHVELFLRLPVHDRVRVGPARLEQVDDLQDARPLVVERRVPQPPLPCAGPGRARGRTRRTGDAARTPGAGRSRRGTARRRWSAGARRGRAGRPSRTGRLAPPPTKMASYSRSSSPGGATFHSASVLSAGCSIMWSSSSAHSPTVSGAPAWPRSPSASGPRPRMRARRPLNPSAGLRTSIIVRPSASGAAGLFRITGGSRPGQVTTGRRTARLSPCRDGRPGGRPRRQRSDRSACSVPQARVASCRLKCTSGSFRSRPDSSRIRCSRYLSVLRCTESPAAVAS